MSKTAKSDLPGRVFVTSNVLDIEHEKTALTDDNHDVGGVCVFEGLVREFSGSASDSLTLEHYPGMTEKMLRKIEAEANDRWPLEASLIVHRYGRLEPGDQIVLVATASPHRQAAFDACAFLIDWLKTKAPFWKLEDTQNEGTRWVEAKDTDYRAAERWEQTDGDAAE